MKPHSKYLDNMSDIVFPEERYEFNLVRVLICWLSGMRRMRGAGYGKLRMDLSVKGKRVLTTAAGAGIGWSMAATFLANGARVHICDIDEDRLAACEAARPTISPAL